MSAALAVAAIACGLMAGVYFTFSTFVMGALAAIPKPEGIAAMQSINRVILSSPFMPLFFLTSLAELWTRYLRDWTRWNHVRTISSSAACVLLTLAAWKL